MLIMEILIILMRIMGMSLMEIIKVGLRKIVRIIMIFKVLQV